MVAFVILHYKSINDTLLCIDSIERQCSDYKIIVVDNGSNVDNDIVLLQKRNIHLITLDENIGFAKGNNVGCKFAIENYSPDFLCVLNSDTIIEQSNFIEKIFSIYDETQFDVLGPKILPENLNSSNPFPVYKTLKEVEESIEYANKAIRIYSSKTTTFLFRIYSSIKHLIKKPKIIKNGKERLEGVGLHGCALIFSRNYCNKFYQNIFYSNTFLYHEEEFLYYRCKKENLKFIYDPEIEIYHNEGKSLDKSIKSLRERNLFRFQEILKSLEELKRVMIKDVNI